MTMLLAASLTVLATGTLPTPAAPAANPFQAYARCSAQCAAASDAGSAPCQTWDWDPTTGKCHLSSTGDPRVGEAAGSAESSDVAAPTSSSPPPSLQKLIAKYAALRNASCGKVLPHVPSLDPGDAAVFMAAYAQFKGAGTNETAVFAAARKLITPALITFLSQPDSIASADGLDADMVRCAVLSDAANGIGRAQTSATHALAKYAVLGPDMEATVDQLLADPVLMRDLLVAGGAASGKYGEAAAIYAEICYRYPEHCQYSQSGAATAAAAAAAGWDGGGCTFTPHCDYGKGSRDKAAAATQDACCSLCTDRPGCAAGVFDGKDCWFKTADEVKGGCIRSARAVAACIPPGIKPPPTPPPPPPPPPAPPLPPAPAPPLGTPWDDRNPATALRRLALAVAVAHADPIAHRYPDSPVNGTRHLDAVDPLVRYRNMAKAYLAGNLDPAFPILTAFELSMSVDTDATEEDLVWVRTTLANYRPDEIAMGYHWRYAESVHSDVEYGDSSCGTFPSGVCAGHYSDIPAGGDVCGGRAFWGRFVRKGFGLPTWGATEHAHASLSAWTPTGWERLLGSNWGFCWWGDQSGQDFYLDTQVRENRTEYQKMLRGGWVGTARGDAAVCRHWTTVNGYNHCMGRAGLWPALMLYMKKIAVLHAPAPNRPIPAAVPPIVNKIDALIARATKPIPPPPPVATGGDGTITIPAVSYTSKNRSASLEKMISFADGVQLLHNGCASSVGPPCFEPPSSSWTYTFTVATAGTFYLTANFTTWHYNQDLMVSVNGAATVEVPVFYSVGWWNRSQPIKATLLKGNNSMTFSRMSVRELVLKEFHLSPKEPVIPKPPAPFTPVPPPPAPPGGAYIEVGANTNCSGQGIQPVTPDMCSHACVALGFKSTGIRGRANMSGCFVMTEGKYANDCNYNSNLKVTCTPPCTVDGAVVRALCTRN